MFIFLYFDKDLLTQTIIDIFNSFPLGNILIVSLKCVPSSSLLLPAQIQQLIISNAQDTSMDKASGRGPG